MGQINSEGPQIYSDLDMAQNPFLLMKNCRGPSNLIEFVRTLYSLPQTSSFHGSSAEFTNRVLCRCFGLQLPLAPASTIVRTSVAHVRQNPCACPPPMWQLKHIFVRGESSARVSHALLLFDLCSIWSGSDLHLPNQCQIITNSWVVAIPWMFWHSSQWHVKRCLEMHF